MPLEGLKGTRLEQIWQAADRHQRVKVEIWNPRQTTVQDVVLGRADGIRLDISSWVEDIQLTQNQVFENDSDSVSSRATVNVLYDKSGIRGGGLSIPISEKLFRDGTPIRIYEGDARIDHNDWPPVFTGIIRGVPGAQVYARGKRVIRLQCFGRAQAFQNQIIVGVSWPYDTDLGDMAVDVAMTEMALERPEIRFGKFDFTTKHKSNALTQIEKLQGINEIMKAVDRKPYFDARGYLVSHNTSFDKAPVYWFDNSQNIISVIRDQNVNSTVNSVEVIGLESKQTKVTQSTQPLATIDITTGYFDSAVRRYIWYSDDRTRRAENTFITSDHGKFLGSGGGGSASWNEIDEFHGKVTIDTGYAPWVIGYIVLTWAVGQGLLIYGEIKDNKGLKVVAEILIGVSMLALLAAMARLGRWEIILFGQPFEYVYQETRAIAALKGVHVADVVELSERIHWLTELDDVKAKAKKILRRELVKGHSYKIRMLSNPIIEIDDLIAIRDAKQGMDDWHIFYVTGIEHTYSRESGDGTMEVSAWLCKVMDA